MRGSAAFSLPALLPRRRLDDFIRAAARALLQLKHFNFIDCAHTHAGKVRAHRGIFHELEADLARFYVAAADW